MKRRAIVVERSIEAPIDDVFDFVADPADPADPAHAHDWRSARTPRLVEMAAYPTRSRHAMARTLERMAALLESTEAPGEVSDVCPR